MLTGGSVVPPGGCAGNRTAAAAVVTVPGRRLLTGASHRARHRGAAGRAARSRSGMAFVGRSSAGRASASLVTLPIRGLRRRLMVASAAAGRSSGRVGLAVGCWRSAAGALETRDGRQGDRRGVGGDDAYCLTLLAVGWPRPLPGARPLGASKAAHAVESYLSTGAAPTQSGG